MLISKGVGVDTRLVCAQLGNSLISILLLLSTTSATLRLSRANSLDSKALCTLLS